MITNLKYHGGMMNATLDEKDIWTHVECPTEQEIEQMIKEQKIPSAFINDVQDIDERPRIEIEDDFILIIMRIPCKSNSNNNNIPFITIPLGITISENNFTTLCYHPTDMIPDFIAYTQRRNILINNKFDLVFKLLLSSSVWFLKYMKQISYQIKRAEVELEKSIKNSELQDLFEIEKCLVFFTTALKGNTILMARLKRTKGFKEYADPDIIEDAETELLQAQETVNIYSDIQSGMMDAFASVISNNQNVIMKNLTSVSIILMIPTLIASFFGMNIPNVFQENHYGFIIVMIISATLSLLGFLFLKRNQGF